MPRRRDADDVGHRALAQARHGALGHQSLLLERAQVLSEPGRARVVFEILGERDSELPGSLQQVHLGAAQVIGPSLVADRLALPAIGQRQAVPATVVDPVTSSRRDAIR